MFHLKTAGAGTPREEVYSLLFFVLIHYLGTLTLSSQQGSAATETRAANKKKGVKSAAIETPAAKNEKGDLEPRWCDT